MTVQTYVTVVLTVCVIATLFAFYIEFSVNTEATVEESNNHDTKVGFMDRRLLKIDNCHFYFPDRNLNYHLVEIKNSAAHCGGRWKEVKLYDDGSTDLIDVCEMLANLCIESRSSE